MIATTTKHNNNLRTAPLSGYPKTPEVTARLCADQFAEALNNLNVSNSNQESTVKQLFIMLSYLTATLSCLNTLVIIILK